MPESSLLPKIADGLTEEQRQQLVTFAASVRIVAQKKGDVRWKRSTLSERTALQMLPYIRHAATYRKDFEIDIFPGANLNTMYLKWQGALQWMLESSTVDADTKTLVALIKSITRARKDAQRGKLIIRFLVSNPTAYIENPDPLARVQAAPAIPSESETGGSRETFVNKKAMDVLEQARTKQGISWKQELIEWCQSGDTDTPFIRKGLVLTAEDLDFVRALADNAELASEITHDTIRLMKL